MFSTRTRVVSTALTAVAITVMGTGVANAQSGVAVSLTVDGRTSQMTTTANTVSALLSEQHVNVDAHDAISPAPITTLVDGESIVVTHTEPVRVRRSTSTATEYVSADTFGDAVIELGIYPQTYGARAEQFRRHQDRTFLSVSFRTPSGADAKRSDALQPDSLIKVDRVRLDYGTTRDHFRTATHRTRTPLVPAGRTRVVKPGRDGIRRLLNVTRYVNGHAVHRRVVSSQLVRHARGRVVALGTGPNWVGLAHCESGGNPRAVSAAGYYGLYQFGVGTWHSVGGKGIPTQWGWREQTYRAWLLYKHRGRAPWPVCGAYL